VGVTKDAPQSRRERKEFQINTLRALRLCGEYQNRIVLGLYLCGSVKICGCPARWPYLAVLKTIRWQHFGKKGRQDEGRMGDVLILASFAACRPG
jgi:hypothetical protein